MKKDFGQKSHKYADGSESLHIFESERVAAMIFGNKELSWQLSALSFYPLATVR